MRISDWSSDVCSSDLRAHPAFSFACEPGDRAGVGPAIAFGVGECHRSFAEHVEAVREALLPLRPGPLERFVDRAAEHKLPAENEIGRASGREIVGEYV